MDADGANQAHLTHGTRPKGPASQPQFSPDGKKIVFEGWKQGRVEIYVMDSDGSHIVDLSRSDAVNANPTFSPDGKEIIFDSLRQNNGKYGIYIMDATDGKPIVKVSHDNFSDLEPAFSPSGANRLPLKPRQRRRWAVRDESRRLQRGPADA
jgi:Tol biopolymer transport system component